MFFVTIHDLKNIKKLKEAGADAIIIGIEGFSIRQSLTISLRDLKEVVLQCHALNLKLYVNALRFFMEDELNLLETFLKACKEADVDGIYYSDEGVFYEAQKQGMESLLIYQPETLITNHMDIAFYLHLGIQSVSLAHECSLEEILQMTEQNKEVEILISGYFSILYSRRMLVTNYLDAIKSNEKGHKKVLDLIESTRQDRMPIVEDDYGTHIFSEAPIQSQKELPVLKEHGLYRFRIDSIFMDDDWTVNVLQAYQNQSEVPGSNHWYYQTTMKKKEDSHE
ncbi:MULTISPECIES: peptidase U32 family protein [Faecalicoccus]|uniref:U32 family peptidase n=1 Tax=Faecalicoccus pleomorphus TaxID=1323 RepID=A0AAW6D0V1_9FIRM|nr:MULTISPECIES: U32 family peptidase [Faecalicoccus]MCI6380711.1 U32 family peptidase [Erysipelotrichaceae bacterium]MDB7981119.1 U32 family peptidase [Faecalicoccus pleomorphus]MDB7983387.1 U32 family peptidase [Faecalicoccus pleomorphus]MDY4869067.1 U32 family peptidase [Faecalicoccus sp.]MDY5109669.1 U32 family peptidase [Faecalicoccus sp.]